MHVGFTVTCRMTDIEAQINETSSKNNNTLVTFSQQGQNLALLMGRLYYQCDILVSLKPYHSDEWIHECELNASALALSAYSLSGITALERLEGDFALVIWDAKNAKLIGMRDPLGGYPLFWTEHDGTIAFSTSIQSLLAMKSQRVLNMEYFAGFIMLPGAGNEGLTEACAYTDINRVLPGTIVTFAGPSKRVECYRYWDWLSQIKDPGTNNVAEMAEQYGNFLQVAVRERIRGNTLAHLSGGMDSTAIALIARNLIGSGVGKTPLHTLSLVYDRLPELARERVYIEEVLKDEREIIAHRMVADDLLDFDSFIDTPLLDEPYAGLWRLAMDRVFIDVAEQVGSETILTGIGADEIHDVQPFYLTDLLRKGQFHNAWQEACKWARARNCSPWAVLFPFGITNLGPARFLSDIGIRRPFRSIMRLNEQNDWSVPPWIAPDFAQRYSLRNRALENVQRRYHSHDKTNLSATLNTFIHRSGGVVRWSIAAPLGITIAHPFLDGRLLSFGLGIQTRLQPEPGQPKPILAEAMRNTLPDSIRNRRRKGHFNEVYYLGLSKNQQHLEMMIRHAPVDIVEMFDKNLLIQSLQEASLAGVNVRKLQHLNCTLSLIKWLCMEKQRVYIPMLPTKVIQIHC